MHWPSYFYGVVIGDGVLSLIKDVADERWDRAIVATVATVIGCAVVWAWTNYRVTRRSA